MNATRIVGLFLLFGTAWVVASDRAIGLLTHDPLWLSVLQSIKGLLFIALSSVLIYVLVRHAEQHQHAALQAQRRQEHERLADILHVSPAVVYALKLVSDAVDWELEFVSHKVEQVTGYPVEHWLAHPGLWRERIHPDDVERVMRDQRQLSVQGWLHHEYRFQHADGGWRWVDDHQVLVRDATGHPTGVIGAWLDVSDRHMAGEHIERLANYDALTGLPNRTLLADRARVALAAAARHHGPATVMHLNIDHFGAVNETLGHAAGDELLREMARRLKGTLRPDDTVSRFGADDFVILLPDAGTREAAQISLRLMAAVAEPLVVRHQTLRLTASLGVSEFPDNGVDLEELTQAAESAVHQAKRDGRNAVRFFSRDVQEQVREALTLTRELRWAVERQQLLLHYQPQVEASGQRIIGLEALVRWQHPELGMVSPARFIPLAEESGLIQEIGAWVLNEALRQLAAWRDQGLAVVPVAVNLSAAQFRHPRLCETLAEALEAHAIPACLLELELTESIAMDNSEFTISTITALKRLGVRLSIDDFGTGYSSLGYLKRFAIDKLKIDRSFVRGLNHDHQDEAIVTAVISLARSLNLHTLAEGVETPEQFAVLRRHGCDELQGFLFGHPVPPDEVGQLLRVPVRQAA